MNTYARAIGWTLFWILTVLETLGMGLAGFAKFTGPVWPGMFAEWGYPAGFAYIIGACEMAGAIGVLIPRLAAWAASGLMVIMLGALFTVLTRETQLGWGLVAIHLSLLSVILIVRTGIFNRNAAA